MLRFRKRVATLRKKGLTHTHIYPSPKPPKKENEVERVALESQGKGDQEIVNGIPSSWLLLDYELSVQCLVVRCPE